MKKHVFEPGCFLTSIFHDFGFHFASQVGGPKSGTPHFWATFFARHGQNGPKSVPRVSQEGPRDPKTLPRASQGRPKSVPQAPQERPGVPTASPNKRTQIQYNIKEVTWSMLPLKYLTGDVFYLYFVRSLIV